MVVMTVITIAAVVAAVVTKLNVITAMWKYLWIATQSFVVIGRRYTERKLKDKSWHNIHFK